MSYRVEEIESRLRSGEDSGWEFKQVEFVGHRPRRPTRGDWADEIAAFANAADGVVLAGVADDVSAWRNVGPRPASCGSTSGRCRRPVSGR